MEEAQGTAFPETVATFTYNGDGDRVRQGEVVQSTPTQTVELLTSYVLDVNTSLPVVLAENGAPYLYGLDLLARRSAPNDWLYYHTDGLGSVRDLSNPQGGFVTHYAYAPFGGTRSASGPSTPFRFTGQQQDDTTGLYYLRARYYNAQTQ